MTRRPQHFRHLARMTDASGIVEHADGTRPRTELGYATDDAGRLLALACRSPREAEAPRLAATAMRFLQRAYWGGGCFRLRLGPDGRWTDDEVSDDASGRAIFGLGVAASVAPWPTLRDEASSLFVDASRLRSVHSRATAYAVLGADALLSSNASHREARALVEDAHQTLPHAASGSWAWPEPRLTYANALLPNALLAVAARRRDQDGITAALDLLDWLIVEEWRQGAFSFAPVGGRGPGEQPPAFDQQPIEAWALAAASARAFRVTGRLGWAHACMCAASWFRGRNDTGLVMFDAASGGGYDGLRATGVNHNQGAESTMAFVAATLLGHESARRFPVPFSTREGARFDASYRQHALSTTVRHRTWMNRAAG
jgi:hypothetical protein